MRILKRPMFRKGGSANSGIMDGLDRGYYANGGTIGGGMIAGTPMGYRTGFEDPTISWENLLELEKFKTVPKYDEDFLQKQFGSFVKGVEKRVASGTTGLAGDDAFMTDVDLGMQLQPPVDPEDATFWKIYNENPEQAYKYWKNNISTWGTKQEEQIKHAKKIGADFDFGTQGPKEIIPPGEVDGPGYVPPVVKKRIDDGGLDSVNLEDAKDSVSDLNKERMKLFAPHMQKRMMADALGAASTAFGESTGDTKQDIANAISAAAAGMGGTKDIYDKVTMLTLQGEIAKDIESAKTQKLSNYEFLYNKAMSKNPKDKAWAKGMLKNDPDLKELVDGLGKSSGYRRFVTETVPDVKGTFAGDDASLKKLKTEELEDGKYYLGPPKDQFITIEGGKITKRESGLE